MIKVLFVCLGNICRSPMAEAIFRDMVKKQGLEQKIDVDSAGIGNWHVGNFPHEGTQEILHKQGISFEGMKARQVQTSDWEEFAYIIAMDAQNISDLNDLRKHTGQAEVKQLMEYVPNAKETDVPDPYFTGNFDYVYELVEEGCRHLLDEIIKQRNLKGGRELE